MNNMKQFYEKYECDEQLSAMARVLVWTHNTNDAASSKCASLSPTKLSAALRVLQPAMGEALKDHYVLELLGLSDPHSVNDIKRALLRHMKAFVLVLGKDFLCITEEYGLQVGNQDFYIDLLFFHRNLSALVDFALKIGQFKPEHMGQLNFHLEALDRDVKKPHENPVLACCCAEIKTTRWWNMCCRATCHPHSWRNTNCNCPIKNCSAPNCMNYWRRNGEMRHEK